MPVIYFSPLVFRPMAWAAAAAGSHPTEILAMSLSLAVSAALGTGIALVARRRDQRSGARRRP